MIVLRLLLIVVMVGFLQALPVKERLLGPGQIPGSSHVLISEEEYKTIQNHQLKQKSPRQFRDMRIAVRLGQTALVLDFEATITSPEPMQLLPAGFALTQYLGPDLIVDSDTWKLVSDEPVRVRFVAVYPIFESQRDLDLAVPWIYSQAGELSIQSDGDWMQPRVYLESMRAEFTLPVVVSTESVNSLRIRARRQGLAQMDLVKPVVVDTEEAPKPQVFVESSHRLRLSRSEVVYEMVSHLTISRHPVREIQVVLPAGFEVSEVSGLDGLGLSFVKHSNLIRFHRDQRDRATFKISGRFVRENPDSAIHLPGLIRMLEVASQRSFMALEASDVLRVREVRFDHTDRVSRVDVTELPAELKPENGEPVLYACRILGDSGSIYIDSELFTRLEPISLVISRFAGIARFQADRGALHTWTYELQVDKPGSYEFEFPKQYEFRSAKLNGMEVQVFSEGEGKIGVDLKSSQILRSGENQSYNLLQSRQMIGGLQNQKLELSLLSPPSEEEKVRIELPLPVHTQNVHFTVQVEEGALDVSVQSSFENPGWERAQTLVTQGLNYARSYWVIILALLLVIQVFRLGWIQAYWLGEMSFWGLVGRLILGLFLGSWFLLLTSQVLDYYNVVPMPQSAYTWSNNQGTHIPAGQGFFLYSLMGREGGHWVEVDFGAGIFPLGVGLQMLFCLLWTVLLVIAQNKHRKLLGVGLGFCALFWMGMYLLGFLNGHWFLVQPILIALWGLAGIFWKVRRQITALLLILMPTYSLEVQVVPKADGKRLLFVSEADYDSVFVKTAAPFYEYPVFQKSSLDLFVRDNRLYLEIVYSNPRVNQTTVEMDPFYSGFLYTVIEPKPLKILQHNDRRILDFGSKLPDSLRLVLVLQENVGSLLSAGHSVRLMAPPYPINSLRLPCDQFVVLTRVPQVSTCNFALPSGRDFTVSLKKADTQIVTQAPTTTRMEFRGLRTLANHKVLIKEGLAELQSRFRLSIEGSLTEALQIRLPEGLLIKSVSASGAEILDWSSSLEKGMLAVNFRQGTAGQVTLDLASEKALGTQTTALTPFSIPQANSLESTWNFEPEVGLEFRLDMSDAMKKSLRQRNPAKTVLEVEEIQTEAGLDKSSAFYMSVVAREGIATFSAFVDLLELFVYLAPDGTMYLRRSLVVRNHAEQFLVLKPMEGEELLTARIQGQRATIGIQGNNWLLPLKMVLSGAGEVVPFSMELTTKIPTENNQKIAIHPADFSLPIAQATLQAGTDSSRQLKLVNPHWHPGGMNPEFQGVLPDSFQGRLLSSSADMPVPISQDSLQRIAWFLTPASRNVSMDIEVIPKISPNLIALLAAGLAIFCLLPSLRTLIPVLFLLPWMVQMPFAYSGAVFAGALLMVVFRVFSQPLIWLNRLFPALLFLICSWPSNAQEWKHKLVDWNQVTELKGYELIPKSRLAEFAKSQTNEDSDKPGPLPVISLDIIEVSTGVLKIDHEVWLPKSNHSQDCVAVLFPGLVYRDLPEQLAWRKPDKGDGLCLPLGPSEQKIVFSGWYHFASSEARIELPEAFIQIRSLKGNSSLKLLSSQGDNSLTPHYLFRLKHLRLAYQMVERPTIVEEIKEFQQMPSQATQHVNYHLSVGTSAHHLRISMGVSVLHQSLQKVVLPIFEGFRLHQLTIQPPQPFQLSGNTLVFPGGILGNGTIQLEGEILATGSELLLPAQDSDLISLGGEIVLTVRENLKVIPAKNLALIEQTSNSEVHNLSEPVLGNWRFLGSFPGFLATMEPLPSHSLEEGLAESLFVKTLMIGRGRVAQAYQARIRVPEKLELSLPLQIGTELMGVYINGEPAKAFMNDSGFLVIQFPVSLSDQVIQLEVKLLEKVQESKRLWLTLPESLKALKTNWEVWYPEEIHVKALETNLNYEDDETKKDWIQANSSEILTVNLFVAMLVTISVCLIGFLLWLLYRIAAFLFSSVQEVLQGIKSPVFQLWLKRIVGISMVVALGVVLLGVLSFGLSLSPKLVDSVVPNIRRAREQSIGKRDEMQNLMQSPVAESQRYKESDYFMGNMDLMEDSQSFEGKAEMEFSPQKSMRKAGSPPPPASYAMAKPSRLQVGQAVKKGNIKPVQVVLPALPNKKVLHSDHPLSEAGWVRIELSDSSLWFEEPVFQTLVWLGVLGTALFSLIGQKLGLLFISTLCLGFLPFPQVILTSLLLPILMLGLMKRKALWAFLLLALPSETFSSHLYQIWDAQNRQIVFEDQVLVLSVKEHTEQVETKYHFCQDLQINFVRLVGQELAEVAYICKLDAGKMVEMTDLPLNSGIISLVPASYPYVRTKGSLRLGPLPQDSQVQEVQIRLMLPVKSENYGDVLRIRLPNMPALKSTVQSAQIDRFLHFTGVDSGLYSAIFPASRFNEDLLLMRRATRWRPGVDRGRETITDSRKPQFTGTWQFSAREWGIESSLNLSIQSTNSIQLNLPEESLLVALSLSADGKELNQGRDYGVDTVDGSVLRLEWKATSAVLSLKVSYRLPGVSQLQTLPFVPVEGGTIRLQVEAQSYQQTRVMLKPHDANASKFRQSLVSHREGWQILNPEPALNGVPMLDIEIREREKVGVSAARIPNFQIHYHYAGDAKVHGKADFQISNPSGQFLAIKIPPAAKLWQVMVQGQTVRLAKAEDGLVLIPLRVAGPKQSLSVSMRWEETLALSSASTPEWQLNIPRPQLSVDRLSLTFTSIRELEFQPVPLSFRKQGKLVWSTERQGGLSEQPIRFKEVTGGLEIESNIPDWPFLEIVILGVCLLGTLKLPIRLQKIVLGVGAIGLILAQHPLAFLVMSWWFYTLIIRQSPRGL